MRKRLPPSTLLFTAVLFSFVLVAVILWLAVHQRWLGMELVAEPEHQQIQISAVNTIGPASTVPAPSLLAALSTSTSMPLAVQASDLLEEPDTLASYADINQFFAQQSRLNQALMQPLIRLTVVTNNEVNSYVIEPAATRPWTQLPLAFWMQIAVGCSGFLIGAWVWTLRPDWPTRFLAMAGFGLMLSAFPAAVYSTRELAIDGSLFSYLSAFNHLGALVFGVGMLGLFSLYPQQLIKPKWLSALPLIFGLWFFIDLMQWVQSPALGFHLAVVIAMLGILLLAITQYVRSRGDPRGRAALTWLALAVVIGAGAFVSTNIAPLVLGLPTLVSQGQAFLFFLIIYVGVALGVARFQLFKLDEWAFRILFYLVGVLLLLALDAVLIFTLVDDRAPAFALSLLIIALTWLPLRDTLARRLFDRNKPSQVHLFRQVMNVVLAPHEQDQQQRWQQTLQELFKPLTMEPSTQSMPAPVAQPQIIDDGLGLSIPGSATLPCYQLNYAAGGTRLFNPADRAIAAELHEMLEYAFASRAAYEQGVNEERARMARDIHDNIGVQLMGALHSSEDTKKNRLIRETLVDLRDIINNASASHLSLDTLVADLRAQLAEHLNSLDIKLNWPLDNLALASSSAQLSLPALHALRSVIREAVQNSLKHAQATAINITTEVADQQLIVRIFDNGVGFALEQVTQGHGLANMQSRIKDNGGSMTIASDADGTYLEVCLPLEATIGGEHKI